jgi:acyl-coenzyme A synthetase/AMP-(fatty) acid ligase
LTLDSDGGWPTYRTGDLVVQRSDGNFLYLGRRDSQIKRRGHRIKPREIEAVLQDHPSVVECAVAAIPDELVTNRIKAYVVAQSRDARCRARAGDPARDRRVAIRRRGPQEDHRQGAPARDVHKPQARCG